MIFSRCILGVIRGYRFCAPFLRALLAVPFTCRYEPSCSHYAEEALRCHGPLKGMRLIAQRLISCHPFSPGGWDPPK